MHVMQMLYVCRLQGAGPRRPRPGPQGGRWQAQQVHGLPEHVGPWQEESPIVRMRDAEGTCAPLDLLELKVKHGTCSKMSKGNIRPASVYKRDIGRHLQPEEMTVHLQGTREYHGIVRPEPDGVPNDDISRGRKDVDAADGKRWRICLDDADTEARG